MQLGFIDKKKELIVEKSVAPCLRCYAIYSIDYNAKFCKKFNVVEEILVANQQNFQLLDYLLLEKGIVGVIFKVKNEKDLTDA